MSQTDGTPRRCVLVVDDEDLLRALAVDVLEMLGHDALSAPDAAAGLKLLEADPQRIDLLFTDLSLPGIDGLELIARCRALRPELPVLIASGRPDAAADRLAAADDRTVFLMKPYSMDDLEATVAALLATE